MTDARPTHFQLQSLRDEIASLRDENTSLRDEYLR